MDDRIIRERIESISQASSVVSIETQIALRSVHCFLEMVEDAKRRGLRDPSLFDAIVLAFSRERKAKILTGDEHFKGRAETV